MGQKYLIDSNVVIDYLKGALPLSGMSLMNHIVNELLLLSVITKIEVLGFSASDKLCEDFIDFATILNLNNDVVNQTINIRKSHKIKLGDAIIASTAIVHSLTLVTGNIDDFKRLKSLAVLNPWE
jgi:predicted nucleic acid-binding protein